MGWLLFFTSLNHLSLLLLAIYGLLVVILIVYFICYYNFLQLEDEPKPQAENKSAALFNAYSTNAHWLDQGNKGARSDPDNDSLMTVTTISSVYKEHRLSIELNERFYR